MTTERIRELNDSFRQKLEGGKVMLTSAVTGLPPVDLSQLIAGVRAYKSFSEENDPHGEHDFGIFVFEDRKIYWKIDVYENDGTFQWGANDPGDPATSYRIVTFMLPEDY